MAGFRNVSVFTLLILALIAIQVEVWADSKKTAEAQALLDKAEKLSRLTEKGSLPFALQATVEFAEGKQKRTADFYLLWQDTEHWRAMAVGEDHRELRVRDQDGLWQSKVPDFYLSRVLDFGLKFPFQSELVSSDTEKLAGLVQREIKHTSVSCVRFHDTNSEREMCFDPTTAELQLVSQRVRISFDDSHFVGDDIREKYRVAVSDSAIEYGDYEKFGNKSVPQTIRLMVGGQVRCELRLVKLAADHQATADIFSPPASYEVWPDCERHTDARPLRSIELPPVKNRVGPDSTKPADVLVVIVGADGKAREVRLIDPTGRNPEQWVDLLMKGRYRPATCDQKAVPGYIFIPVSLMSPNS